MSQAVIDFTCFIINNTNIFVLYLTGGYTTGPKELVSLLRQKSRPYLFSNTLPPPVVASADKVSLIHSTFVLNFVLNIFQVIRLDKAKTRR